MGSLATSTGHNLDFLQQEVKIPFSRREATTSPDLGNFAALVSCLLAFQYGSKLAFPRWGLLPHNPGNIRQLLTWTEICQLLTWIERPLNNNNDNNNDNDNNNAEPPYSVYPPKAPY